ncbi:MAG: R3H domain protein [Parcubacteria group bacterium GW2011_GWF2_50_9]|nr:MAG: R3H domain protein [Parcubacteria group bacterium GW2011_GWF2_50_9]OHA20701.1 MAG: hypothetical protein A2759_03765 [Candidatus Taylorbacteria bacterium RIFCSPHIGHO2_01_FULL_49_60]
MNTEDIKRFIVNLLGKMNIGVDDIEVTNSGGRECFSVRTPDSYMLIGTRGAHLFALNHIVKKIVSSKAAAKKASGQAVSETASRGENGKEPSFFIDVNGYQEAAAESVKNLAKIMGERARSFKTDVELEPMSSYNRMIIHSFFQEAADLKTESVGEGERRRVVIKYVEDKAS